MRLKNIGHVRDFLDTVNRCNDEVWLESDDGDRINLKSSLSQYVAVAALVGNEADNLCLYCNNPADEAKFFVLFSEHPDIEL